MIITTTEFVPGYEVTESLGIVTGNTVRAKHILDTEHKFV